MENLTESSLPLPDNGNPIQVGDISFVYKNTYHPIYWIGDEPYRPRVETLVVKNGKEIFLRLYDTCEDGFLYRYRLPGGAMDNDSSPIEQAKNETNEEALIELSSIFDSGIEYYTYYENGKLLKGGDICIEYKGTITNVFIGKYKGKFDKSKIEKHDLDDDMANNGKFYPLTKVCHLLRPEHIDAIMNSDLVDYSVKGSIRLILRGDTPIKENYVSQVTESVKLPFMLYHGGRTLYDELRPTGIDFGNAFQKAGWSLFCWTKYSAAIGWGVFSVIKYLKSLDENIKIEGCKNSQTPIIDESVYNYLKENLDKFSDKDRTFYVYSVKPKTDYKLGLGHSSNTPNCITIRKDHISPDKIDEFVLNMSYIDKYCMVVPVGYKVTAKDMGLNGRATSFLMTNDYMYNHKARKPLTTAYNSGELSVGDDISKYAKDNNIHINKVKFNDRVHDMLHESTTPTFNYSKFSYVLEDYVSDNITIFNSTNINEDYDVLPAAYEYFSNIIENEYKTTDPAHDKRHIYQVTNTMLYLGKLSNLDLNLCLAIGSLHDIGIGYGPREDHHINSAKWVRNHRSELSNFYSSEDIKLIETAVKEHRSSIKVKSNIYSETITDADKMPSHDAEHTIMRAWVYTKAHNQDMTDDECFENMYNHIHEKYGKANVYGNKFYTKYAIEVMKPKLAEILKYTNNKTLCRKKLEQMGGFIMESTFIYDDKPMYFYHMVPKGTVLNPGITSLEYQYRHNQTDLFNKYTNKYRNRISGGWGIYPDTKPEDLTTDQIRNALNTFRDSEYGCSFIYLFKFPPYKTLGREMKEILKHKDLYRIDLNEIKGLIEEIDYGHELSNKDNNILDRDYYMNVTPSEYFDKYTEKGDALLFSYMNHISIRVTNNYIPKKYCTKIDIPDTIDDIMEDYSTVTESVIDSRDDIMSKFLEKGDTCANLQNWDPRDAFKHDRYFKDRVENKAVSVESTNLSLWSDSIPKNETLYHASPVQGIKYIEPRQTRAYPDLGPVVFSSKYPSFAACFGTYWNDTTMKQGTDPDDMNHVSLWIIDKAYDWTKPCSMYILDNDGSFRNLEGHPHEHISPNKIKVKKEIKFKSFYDMVRAYNIEVFDYNTKQKLSVLESAEVKRSELPDEIFGIPSERKYPLDTEKHVRSAIKLFNYVKPEQEEELAKNIIKRMSEFDITDISIGEKNRFSKYYNK